MKRITALVIALMALVGGRAEDIKSYEYAGWTITLYTSGGNTYQRLDYQLNKETTPNRQLFHKVYCTALYQKQNNDGSWTEDRYLDSYLAGDKVDYEESIVSDEFGYGHRYRFTYHIAAGSEDSRVWDEGDLIQDIFLYANHPYLITQITVRLKPDDKGNYPNIRSNYLLPMRNGKDDNKYTEFEYYMSWYNWIKPSDLPEGSTIIPDGDETLYNKVDDSNRVLEVPFDNDMHKWWASYDFSNSGTSGDRIVNSWNVTAIYNGGRADRCGDGLIIGAIDHDTWKNNIKLRLRSDHQIRYMEMRSGYATTDQQYYKDILGGEHGTYEGGTHDLYMGHSYVPGQTVSSARFLMAWMEGWNISGGNRVVHPDWRDGMELYAEACQLAHPSWKWMGRKPIGWSSWGALQFDMTSDRLNQVKANLQTLMDSYGFKDADGKIYFSIDSGWDETEYTSSNWSETTSGIRYSDLEALSQACADANMLFGLYITPFTDWSRSTGENYVPGTNNAYKWKDLWLYQTDEYGTKHAILFDNADNTEGYALDPTHPGTRMYILYKLNLAKKLGAHYLKLDFLSHGAVEADSWYDTNIHTGMQAYNQGMQFIKNWIQSNYPEGDMFVNLSIAPMMSHPYAHGRRIACDTFSKIAGRAYLVGPILNGTTQEEMNAQSFGWWLSHLYAYNDPDHLVLRNRDGKSGSEAENRARLTSGLVTGMFLLGDNFSNSNVDSENYELALTRAKTFLGKAGFMDAVRNSQTGWRPLYANWVDGNDDAESLFCTETNKAYYVACINYTTEKSRFAQFFVGDGSSDITIDLRYHLGLTDAQCQKVKGVYEIWNERNYTLSSDYKFTFTVPAADALVFCIEKTDGEDDKEITSDKNFYSKDTQNQFDPLYRGAPSLADYNNSGRLSIYYGGQKNEDTPNDATATAWQVTGMLYTNKGNDTFAKTRSWCTFGSHNVTEDAHGLPPMTQGYSRWFDYNNDGNLDFFVNTLRENGYNPSSRTMLYKNGGSESGYTFTKVADFLDGQNEHGTNNNGANNSSVSFADYDRDGYTDIVQQAYTDGRHVTLYHNNGDGTFTAKELRGQTHGGVTFGDLTGNGYPDIVSVGYGDGCEFYIHQNNGDGTFTEINAVSAKGFRGLMNCDVALADLDGDGDLDIIATGCGSDWGRYTDIYINNGSLNFTKKEQATHNIHGANEGTLHVVDINRDGRPDVIISGDFGKKLTDAENSSGQGVRIYLQKEDGTFEMEYKSGLGILSSIEQYGGDCGSGFAMGDLYGRHAQEVVMNGRLYAEAYKLYNANTKTPGVPQNVTVTWDKENTATVTWKAASETGLNDASALGYNVYVRNMDTGETAMLLPAHIGGSLDGRLKTFQDMQNTIRGNKNQTYSYSVRLNGGRYQFGVQTVDPAWATSNFVVAKTTNNGDTDEQEDLYILEVVEEDYSEAGDSTVYLRGALTAKNFATVKKAYATAYDLERYPVSIPQENTNLTALADNPNVMFFCTEAQLTNLSGTKNMVVGTTIHEMDLTDAKPVHVSNSLKTQGQPIYRRSLSKGTYGTLMLPFDVPQAQLAANSLTAYKLTATEVEEDGSTKVQLNFVETGDGLEKGVTYVLKNNKGAKNNVVLMGANGTEVDFVERPTGSDYKFRGSYKTIYGPHMEGFYVLPSKSSIGDDGAESMQFSKCTDKAWGVAFHCYLTVPSGVDVKSFVAHFYRDWEDGVGAIDNEQMPMGSDVYDLSGRKMVNGSRSTLGSSKNFSNAKLRKGVYIIDGEKRAVK